ncbi:hypothetical protein [Schinkia azotoformans]|uniref:hypothetical protein n=1 Tax=Schinkia azotoformans TaxID=1454 RepID=UPI002DBF66EC|nr:hypothetical protein [Schinkia azotoformans]MEC1780054.1 hypothetical protein [Schinkia azotoformans]MED4330867.1 hypothetical protein [Schinkia azotoformans]
MEGQKTTFNLDKQVHVYTVTTDAFLNPSEKEMKQKITRLEGFRRLRRKKNKNIKVIAQLERTLSKETNEENKVKIKYQIAEHQHQLDYLDWISELYPEVIDKDKKEETKKLVDEIDNCKHDFRELVKQNKEVRKLNKFHFNAKGIVSLFSSTLTRKLGMPIGKLSEEIIIIEVYNSYVLEDLLKDGFYNHLGEHYIYFSSSSGQIRNRKTMWVKKKKWDKVHMSLMCGLTEDDINKKGGITINKFLSYKALTTSASTPWTNFKNLLNHSIVVNDVEVELFKTVDYVSRDTYEVERKENHPITLEITDGAGMALPEVSEELFGEGKFKNWQFRAPWMKGLLSSVPFNKVLDGKDSLIVKDAWGTPRDIIKESIKIIFFKSQMKMVKYFDSWEHYKKNFIDYNCEASIMNPEEDIISDAKTNYQYMQSLIDVIDEELDELVESTNNDIENLGRDKDTMFRVLGCDEDNENKNYLQQALEIFPEMLRDDYVKQTIKNKKSSMVEQGRSAKLNIDGKFTYVLPDWFYVINRIFFNDEKALLQDGQVHCNLYDEGKVDLLRSPSLSFEHVIHENVISDEMKEWFITKGVYVSPFSMCSKLLQMDYDGDRIMVTPSKNLISIVERNAKLLNVVPLEYQMGTADPMLINPINVFECLKIGFKAGGNIGEISNNISKVWNANKDEFDYKVIKQLTAYTNYTIDASKTLDLPEPPSDIKEKWKTYTDQKLPHFFKWAKKKENKEVLQLKYDMDEDNTKILSKEESTVNRLSQKISTKNVHFASIVDGFDYKFLLNECIKDDEYYFNEETDQKIIKMYDKYNKNKKFYMNNDENNDSDKKNKKKKKWFSTFIMEKLLEIEPDTFKVADVLIRYLYQEGSPFKSTLWEVFGEYIVDNLKWNLEQDDEVLICHDCNCRFRKVGNKKKRCEECKKKHERKEANKRKKKEREDKKTVTK